MHPWFAVQPVTPRTWLIAEPGHVNSWLVAGRERAVLIDSGLGIAPIRPLAESLTPLPLSVVNTHAHFDHIGGNREFADIAIHPLGLAKLRQGVPVERLTAYLAYMHRLIAAAERYRELDRSYFFLIDNASDPRPLPPAFKGEDWRIGPSDANFLLNEGDAVDLGGRSLRVLHTPGHSPDSICLFDESDGTLFAGDTINTGPIYGHLPDSDIAQFAASTARLKALSGEFRRICVSHFGRAVVDPGFLSDVAEGFAQVQAGEGDFTPSKDALGRPVREARFPRFSILVAP